MAEISEIPFNPSGPSSAIRSKEQAPAQNPPAREAEEVQNEDRSQSTAGVERAAQQEERANATKEAETRNDSVRLENRRDQIVEDVIDNQEQGLNSLSALEGLDEANPIDDDPEDASTSPAEVSRNQIRRQDAGFEGIDEQELQEAPGARADEVRNERANEVAQDSLRSIETRNQETTGSGSNAEAPETVTPQREEARVAEEPAFDVPEQRVNEAGTTGPEQSSEPANNQGQGRENEPPERPADAPTERGLNIDRLI